uniref:Uncharacterized protein n=1 Tax=viral metagenome TaxID=1070528 RepID=A0A6M3KFY8_9ZZZZ
MLNFAPVDTDMLAQISLTEAKLSEYGKRLNDLKNLKERAGIALYRCQESTGNWNGCEREQTELIQAENSYYQTREQYDQILSTLNELREALKLFETGDIQTVNGFFPDGTIPEVSNPSGVQGSMSNADGEDVVKTVQGFLSKKVTLFGKETSLIGATLTLLAIAFATAIIVDYPLKQK